MRCANIAQLTMYTPKHDDMRTEYDEEYHAYSDYQHLRIGQYNEIGWKFLKEMFKLKHTALFL